MSKDLFGNLSLEVLDIKPNFKKILQHYGFETLNDLCQKNSKELAAISGISAITAGRIKRELKLTFGMNLAKDPPKPKKEKPNKSVDPAKFEEVKALAQYLFNSLPYEKNFGVELSIARKLIDMYGFDRMSQIQPNLKAKYPAFYLTSYGKEYIAIELSRIDRGSIKKISVLAPQQEDIDLDEFVETSQREVEIIEQAQQKPKSFKDFIKF